MASSLILKAWSFYRRQQGPTWSAGAAVSDFISDHSCSLFSRCTGLFAVPGTPQVCSHFSLFWLFFPLPRIPFSQVFQAEYYLHGLLLLPFKCAQKWNSQSCFSWISSLKLHPYFHIPCSPPYFIIFFLYLLEWTLHKDRGLCLL